MLSSLRNIFKVPDLRNKVLFTIADDRDLPLRCAPARPGHRHRARSRRSASQANQSGVLGFLTLFSGGAITNFAIFALGIMPYITASIILQILGVVIPKLEEWQEQGAVGQRKITQWTRYVTIGIAVVQSTGLAYLFHKGGGGLRQGNTTGIDLVPHYNAGHVALIVLTLTTGTALLMWMGELITQRGIGNGMSLLIFASVVSTLPAQGTRIQASAGWGALIVTIIVFIGLLVAIVFIEQGQRRIPVQFAKRQVGRRVYGGQSTYIPLKVTQAGVIPIIFASSVLYLPQLLSFVLPGQRVGRERAELHQQPPVQPGLALLPRHLRPAHHRVHLLLHGHHLRSGQAGRHAAQAGRVHPRHPTRAPDRALHGQVCSTASPCPAPCSSPGWRWCPRGCSATTCPATRCRSRASRC